MTPKQEAFVREYLIDLNASAAAKRAGYKGDANTVGPRLLANVGIRSHIEKAKQARAERTEVDADWVLKRLHGEATADLADLYDSNGNLKAVHDWPMVWRTGLVAGIETVQERDGTDADGAPTFSIVRKVKLADRVKLVELIGKHTAIGAFKERLEIDANVKAGVTYQANMPRRGG